MTISVVFDPPLLADSPTVFNSKAFTLVGNLNTFSTQANSTASDINAQVTDPGVVAIGKDLTGANTIGNVSGISANVTTVAGISANVTTVAGISANVTTVADNTANINAAVADLPALAAKVSKTGDTMTGNLNVPSLNGGQLAGHRNKLINGSFEVNQRGLTSVADDAYCLDRWYVLTETGNVTVAQLTDPESGAPWGIRLTQPDATAKRIGFAQIIESRYIRQFASKAMNLSARLRLSTAANIRYAVIEHTGTADVVTSDVVNNWASATFTPSNFFIAGVNIISTGTIAPGAATWGEVSDWDALGADVRNVIVFIWTESQVAQDVTLDCSRIQYEPGVVATPHEWRMNELQLCQRRFFTSSTVKTTAEGPYGLVGISTTVAVGPVRFPVQMARTPAVILYSTNNGAANTVRWNAANLAVTSVTGIGAGGFYQVTVDSGGATTQPCAFHVDASAEL